MYVYQLNHVSTTLEIYVCISIIVMSMHVDKISMVFDHISLYKLLAIIMLLRIDTVTPFAAIKVWGFEIMTFLRPFNFAVSNTNYFTIFYITVVFFYIN